MLVKDIMQVKVTTVTPQTTLPEALHLAQERRIRHLPVVEGGELVGIVSDRDLKRAMASPATSLEIHELNYLLNRLRIAEIMTREVITTNPACPVEDAARRMVSERISALPVLDGGQLVGILTETDVLELFLTTMGSGEPSSRLEVLLPERPSALGEIMHAAERAGITVSSIVTLTNRDSLRTAVVRIRTINPRPMVEALEAKGYAIRDSWSG